MAQYIAAEVSLAFNAINPRKTWSARPNSRGHDGRETVHFTAPANLVTIVLECDTGKFTVRFNKVHAAWGDYIRAIARSLYVVLTTLKQAGLPFDAPDSDAGIEIVATSTSDSTVYVRWPGQEPPQVAPGTLEAFMGVLGHGDAVEAPEAVKEAIADATMPEVRYSASAAQMIEQTARGAEQVKEQHDALIAAGAVWDGMDGYDMTQYQKD